MTSPSATASDNNPDPVEPARPKAKTPARSPASPGRGKLDLGGKSPMLHRRSVLSLLLTLPLLLMLVAALGSYLFFTYQNLLDELGDREYHLTFQAGEALSEEVTLIHLDLIRLLGDQSVRGVLAGESDALPITVDRLAAIQQQRGRYALIALLDAAGNELLRVDGEGNATFPVGQAPVSHAERDYFINSLDRSSGIIANGLGAEDGQFVIYFALPVSSNETETAGVVLLAYLAENVMAPLNELAVQSEGLVWLLSSSGQWVMGGPETTASDFQDPEGIPAASEIYPELWSLLEADFDGSLAIDAGIVSYAAVCVQLNCSDEATVNGDSTDNSLAALFSGGGSSGKLVSFLPRSQLSFIQVMGAQPERWIYVTGLVILAGLLSITAALFLAYGVARLRNNEARLQRANILQDAFFEKNPEIMFVKNLDGSYYLANEQCRQLAGKPDRDFTGVDRTAVFPEDAATSMQQQDIQVIQSEEAMEFQTRWKREGVMHHFKTLRFPMYDVNGELIAVGGIANDVTDQVQSRHALIENERLLRTFIESAPDAVLITDTEGKITLVNKAAESIFDYERTEMLQINIFDLINGLDSSDYKRVLSSITTNISEVSKELHDGTGLGNHNRNFPLEFSLAPVRTDDGALMICVLRDVSEKALMETQLRQSQKMEAIGKLTGGMAHDFNNLLGIIIGNVALAKRAVKENERATKRLDTAIRAAERGAELTKRMLAVARRQPLQPKPVSINEIISEMTQMLPQTLGSDVEMELDLQKDLPAILVDESSFESMILNLAINARDAMPHGGKFIIETSIKPREDIERALPLTSIRGKQYVHICVADTGAGMSEEALNRAFEPFFTTKEKGKGTGLGLAMIYGFVKQSHGYIVIDSKVDQGTRISIYLPGDAALQVEPGEQRKNGKVVPLLDSTRTVLVVDDEVDLLDIAQAYLEEMGLKVLTAAGGVKALELVREHEEIDLMITDVVMPGGINGPILAVKVRELRPDLPVLYASGFPSGDIREASGVVLDAPLINKPYTRESLAAMVLQTLANQKTNA